MILNDAIEMTRQIAADSYVQLGEMRTARPSGPNPDAPHYLFIFEGPECPAGWSWYVNVSGKFKVAQIVAHNPNLPGPSEHEREMHFQHRMEGLRKRHQRGL